MEFAKSHEMHPLLLGMIWTFSAGGKLFAYQSGVLIVGYSYGYFAARDLVRMGACLTVVEFLALLVLVPFGQVRLLPRAHRRLRPPAFPTRSRPRLVGTAMEISRFPGRRLLRMPGSTTTRGWLVSCDDDTDHLAFCWTENISAPNLSYAAQYLAYALPYQRFACGLAATRA
jgi:hypothetical protein